MGTIYNSDMMDEIREGSRIQQNVDPIPNRFSDFVQPVMEVNPKSFRRINVVKENSRITTGSTALYTTPTDRDFFLVAGYLQAVADATADNTTIYLLIQPIDSAEVNIIQMRKLSLTAFSEKISFCLPFPIKIKRGTTISFGTTYTVGACVINAVIMGYTISTNA